MDKKVLNPLGIVIVLLLLIGIFTKKFPNYKLPTNSPMVEVQGKVATISDINIDLEIVNTDALRQKGLGGRASLAENSGMLFVFDAKPVIANFWMKDMLIPIDIIWIKDNKILRIDKNVPFYPPDTPDSQLKTYSPQVPIDYVLEVNSGFSDKNNFKIGDVVTLPTL